MNPITETTRLRVLIVDDQAMARRGLAVLLEEDQQIAVIGEAASGLEAVTLAQELTPDVVLMDVRMPGGDGIQATRELSGLPSPIPVLLITTFDIDEYVLEGLEAGASGFLLKSCTPAELTLGVWAAARGVRHIDSSLIIRALTRAQNNSQDAQRSHLSEIFAFTSHNGVAETFRESAAEGIDLLTQREREVLAELSTGASNAEIARTLGLAPGTIKTYLQRIQNKIDVNGRTSLVAWSFRNGISR